jgi:2-phosphosulfolactate phosphatase
VFVAGYANAGAVAAHLQARDRPVTLVACGTDGDPTVDDLLGAVVVDRYLRGRPLDDTETRHFERLLVASKGPDYGDARPWRRRDLEEFATAIDRRWVVPRLDDDRLVDATRESEGPTRTGDQ